MCSESLNEFWLIVSCVHSLVWLSAPRVALTRMLNLLNRRLLLYHTSFGFTATTTCPPKSGCILSSRESIGLGVDLNGLDLDFLVAMTA